ncbi:hypothetical protein RQP46_007331 [Phenoliferia psychrophenolica]
MGVQRDLRSANGDYSEWNGIGGRVLGVASRESQLPPRDPHSLTREITDRTVSTLTTKFFAGEHGYQAKVGRSATTTAHEPVDAPDSDAADDASDDDEDSSGTGTARSDDDAMGASGFVPSPKSRGPPLKTAPLFPHRSPSKRVKTTLPASASSRAVETVFSIRTADPSTLRPRKSSQRPPVKIFQNKTGPKRADLAHLSQFTKAEIAKAREQIKKRAEAKAVASVLVEPIKRAPRDRSLTPTDSLLTDSEDLFGVVSGNVPTAPLVTRRSGSRSNGTQGEPSPTKDALSLDGDLSDDGEDDAMDVIEISDNGTPEPDPLSAEFYGRFDELDGDRRDALVTEFLVDHAAVFDAPDHSPLLKTEAATSQLTPITNSFGGFTNSAARLRPLVDPLGWLTGDVLDTASSTINYLGGWTPGVSQWSGSFFVLPVMWTQLALGTQLCSDILLSDCEYLIAPLNINDSHWILIVACLRDQSIRVFNSMGRTDRAESNGAIAIKPVDYPTQPDGAACGIYTFFGALSFAQHALTHSNALLPVWLWGGGATIKRRTAEVARMRREMLDVILHMRVYGDLTDRPESCFRNRPREVTRSPVKVDLPPSTMPSTAGPDVSATRSSQTAVLFSESTKKVDGGSAGRAYRGETKRPRDDPADSTSLVVFDPKKRVRRRSVGVH